MNETDAGIERKGALKEKRRQWSSHQTSTKKKKNPKTQTALSSLHHS